MGGSAFWPVPGSYGPDTARGQHSRTGARHHAPGQCEYAGTHRRTDRACPLLLGALAERDNAGLLAVAANIPPVRITKADLAHSADARGGLATVTFLPASIDVAYVPAAITSADGASDWLGIQNMIAMGGPSAWRMTIGADVNPSPAGPPSAGPVP